VSAPVYAAWRSWPEARAALTDRLPSPTLARLDAALAVAEPAHAAQRRPAGEPYVEHLLQVLEILVASGARDPAVLTAGVLHDVVEDTPTTLDDVRAAFGERVAGLVDWLTKEEPAPGEPAVQARRRYLARLRQAPAEARAVKLADRISNVQRLDTYPDPVKRERYRAETVAELVPLAADLPWFSAWFAAWGLAGA
jgi:(p)ppGpp synthase/HD superfamily hydrolase